jgi:hypothetical protein
VKSFKSFINEKCNVCANEIKRGDKVKDINPTCKEYGAEGTVTGVEKIKDGKNRKAGNLVKIKVKNKGKNFKPGDVIKKTEIQLNKKS